MPVKIGRRPRDRRYVEDHEYRKRILAASKINWERNRMNPVFVELSNLRSFIAKWREAIVFHQRKAVTLEKRLLAAVKHRDELQAIWNQQKRKRGGDMRKSLKFRHAPSPEL